MEVFQVYRKHPPASHSWAHQPGWLRTSQFLRPRHGNIIWCSHTSHTNLTHNQKWVSAGRPPGQIKMHPVPGRHTFTFLSMSHLLLTLFLSFCCRVYYFGMPLGGLFGSKITSFNSMCCSRKQGLFPGYLKLDSKYDASLFPNPPYLPPLASPWLRRLTNV